MKGPVRSRVRVQIPAQRTLFLVATFGLAYAISDQAISAAVHAPGSWLTWQAITFICGLLTCLGSLALFAYRLAVPQAAEQRREVDYAFIASMEIPIWGDAFEHAGAPAPVQSKPRSTGIRMAEEPPAGTCDICWAGGARFSGRCLSCENELRRRLPVWPEARAASAEAAHPRAGHRYRAQSR